MARRSNQRTIAQARRDRAALFAEIKREHKRADRAKLEALRGKLRAARAERRRAIASARAACKTRGRLPTLRQLAADLRAAKAAAKATCSDDRGKARALKGEESRRRAELRAEQAYQRSLRRIERANAAKLKEAKRPGVAKTRASESDDEVRGNIPPELVYLFERVKRSIKGSDRMSRTEAFLKYAEENPDEELGALEDRTDQLIRAYEARMANPKKKKKKKKGKRGKGKRASPKKAKRRAPRKLNAKKRAPAGSIHQGELFMAPSGQLVLVEPSAQQRALKKGSASSRTRELFAKKNPHRRIPGRWFDACLASVSGQRYARDPAAVCNAAWYRMPLAKRRATVAKLQRGSARDRRLAVAIAKSEQRRHDGRRGARKPNPPHSVPLVALAYEEQKEGDRKPHVYEHVFEGQRPRVVMRGGKLTLVGGSQRTKDGWIEG